MKECLLLAAVIGLVACKNTPTNQAGIKDTTAIVHKTLYRHDSYDYAAMTLADSIRMLHLLAEVLQIAEQQKNQSSFRGSIDSLQSNTVAWASYQFGAIFEPGKKHLIIKLHSRKKTSPDLYSNIYLLENGAFRKLVTDTSGNGYYSDTLMDVNGDDYKDYLVSSYSNAGCCPRDVKNTYLYNATTGDFRYAFLFNAEFDPVNRIVYEMEYGASGQVPMHKYKWVGLQKIEIESTYPTYKKNYKGAEQDVVARPYTFTKTLYPSGATILVKDIPSEYKKLGMFKYFILYQ